MTPNKDLDPIRFRKDFSYSRRVPTFVCNGVSGSSEIARWVLNINQILHIERRHAPRLYLKKVNKLTGNDGLENNPVLINTDSLIYTAESIVQYFDRIIPSERRLFPDDEIKKKEVVKWFKLFTNELDSYIWKYVYSELLRKRKHAIKLLKDGVPFIEKLILTLSYGSIKKGLIKQWDIEGHQPVEFLVEIQKIFEQVDELLKDGREYLTGDKITAADIAFASIAAPVILPQEFGGSITKNNQISEELRQEIIDLRATPAGQFVMRLYQKDRPINLDLGPVPKKPGFLKRIFTKLTIKLTSNQGNLFYFLQKRFPFISIGPLKIVIVSRHDLVVDVLERDRDFTVREINAKKCLIRRGHSFWVWIESILSLTVNVSLYAKPLTKTILI